MVRMAMASGQGAALWPRGVTCVEECPNDLALAVMHAVYILEASENLLEDEHMPEWKWAFTEEVQAHFERIKEARKKKFGGKSDDDDEPPNGWVQNELARNLR